MENKPSLRGKHASDGASAPAGAAEAILDLDLALPAAERQARFGTTAETAERFGVSQRTMQLWIQQGHLQAVRIGSKYRIDGESVRAYLRRRANPSD